MNPERSLNYRQSGVDIDAGNELVERIKPAIKSTRREGCIGSIGGFGGLFELPLERYRNPLLVSGTDGVGTKLKLAIELDRLDGIDLSQAIRGEACEALQAHPGVIMEYLNPFGGEGTEFRMIRSDRYKYVAFRGCDDLAFDLAADPDEQHNIVDSVQPDTAAELEKLKDALFDGFDFDEAIERRTRETAQFQ